LSHHQKRPSQPPVSKTGTFFVFEEVPFEGRRRWYGDWDGADAPSFDDLEEAVSWGLDRAAGVVVRTLDLGFYLAGEHPPDWGHDLELRPWPPSKADRRRIDEAYAAAVARDAQDEMDQRDYEVARSAWLAENAPHLRATAPEHECVLEIGESDDILAFEEFSPDGSSCGCRARRPGRWAFGAPATAIGQVLGREPDDPWLVAIVAVLDHDRTWNDGGRQHLLAAAAGRGEMFHVSALENRGSILQHGLDWRCMGAAPGIAGATRPEAPAVFLCTCVEEADFFIDMASPRPVDVWAVQVDGFWIETGPNGFSVVAHAVSRDRLRLIRTMTRDLRR
jgi:hypothetical protein